MRRTPKILVLGDLIIDEYVYGECTRISPEAPVPVVKESRRVVVPGGAGNVAENLKELGAEVRFWCDSKSCHKLRVIAGHQHVVRVDNDDCRLLEPPADLEAWVEDANAVVISDYSKGAVTGDLILRTNAACCEFGRPLLVDPYNGKCEYGTPTLIKPNRAEAQSVTGIMITDEKSLHAAGYAYLENSKAESVVVTLGSDGMAYFDRGKYYKAPYRSKSSVQHVFDVTGAGDTAIAAFAYVHATCKPGSFSKRTVVDFANKAAGVVVGKIGTATVRMNEIFDDSMFLNQCKET